MTKSILKTKILSLLLALTLTVCMVSLSAVASYADECVHSDDDSDGICNSCGNFDPTVRGEVKVGENNVTPIYSEYGMEYYTFTPDKSGTYSIVFQSDTDPFIDIRTANGNIIDSLDDDINEYNFKVLVEFTEKETYYLGIGDHNGENSCKVIITRLCDKHTLAGETTCYGTLCSVCNEYVGDVADHTTESEQTCSGYLCKWCKVYYGESNDKHNDEDLDGFCDICNEFAPDVKATLTEGTAVTAVVPDDDKGYYFYKFVPAKSVTYVFKATSSASDPKAHLYSADGTNIASDDDGGDGNLFRIAAELEASETYYLAVADYDKEAECSFKVLIPCENHTASDDVNCFGVLCSVCEERFGEITHVYTDYAYDEDDHWSYCDKCVNYNSTSHSYDDEGNCICGYFEHEHEYEEIDYDAVEHWIYCSLCGFTDELSYERHAYNSENLCECGRERLVGILFGDIHLEDGEYLDNSGNVTDTLPEGGYAYYKDGVLTLSSFIYKAVEDDALHTESDLEIVLIGTSRLTAECSDGIFATLADITLGGTGTLHVYAEDDHDGMDMHYGDLTINSGNIYIDATDHGIELDFGNVVINGGNIDVRADDDGFDIGEADLTVNDGVITIDADDYGIDVSYDYTTTINGGKISIYVEDYDGIESGNVIISGGEITIITEDGDGIYAYESVTISGGRLSITLKDTEDYYAIRAYEGITLPEDSPYGTVEIDDDYALALDGEALTCLDLDLTEDDIEDEPKDDIENEPEENLGEADHSDCDGGFFARIFNAIINFFRRLFGMPEKCICGEELV